MKTKTILIFLVAIFLLVLLIFPWKKKEDKLVLVLDYGNDYSQSFRLFTTQEKRAWSILQEVAAVAKIDLEATNDFYPQKIDGLTNGLDNKNWNFYVNGVKQESSPFEAVVKPPAEVVFRFE